MNPSQLAEFRTRLEKLLSRLRPDVDALSNETLKPSGGQGGGELSNAPMHLGDSGTEEYLHDLSATLLENTAARAAEVWHALERIDDGTFGTCESCGRQILLERLQALPFVRQCRACSEKETSSVVNLNSGRPRNPGDTFAPEGEMNEDRRAPSNDDFSSDRRTRKNRNPADRHAAGTPGGGTAFGGLAGSNEGRGDPDVADLEDAAGDGGFDPADADDPNAPQSGRTGGAVGGTPAGKRAKPR